MLFLALKDEQYIQARM